MRAVRIAFASRPEPKSAPMASAIGYIIAAAAVLEIQSETKAVASITPRTTRRAVPPTRDTIA